MSAQSISVKDQRVEVTIQPLPFGGAANIYQYVPPPLPHGVAPVAPGMMSEAGLGYPYPPVSTRLPVPTDQKTHDIGGVGEKREGEEEKERSAEEITGQKSEERPAYLDYAGMAEMPPEYEISRPPPQVMTVLGPMPLPPEIHEKIPEKFVAKPILEEREIYVAKKEVQERTIEIPHVQYEHRFNQVPKSFTVDRLVPNIREVVKEVPREVYKQVLEEKIIEVPQGVKYVEVPVEVPCSYPPKIVPKPVTQLVERVVETIKPVVKQKLIEIPQTVVKQVPKVRTVEVPYYVPRYKEKVIEVPYKPPASGELPMGSVGDASLAQLPGMPSMFGHRLEMPFSGVPFTPFTLGPMPLAKINEIKLPYEAKINVKVTQPEFFNQTATTGGGGFATVESMSTPQQFLEVPMAGEPMAHGIISGTLSSYPADKHCAYGSTELLSSANRPPSGRQGYEDVKLPEGLQWGAPSEGPPATPGKTFDQMGLSGLQYPSGKTPVPPMMVTCPPEVGRVKFASYLRDPDILTRGGVLPYEGFKRTGNAQMLFPPLPVHAKVPMAPPPAQPGTPDVRTLDTIAGNMATYSEAGTPLFQRMKTELLASQKQTQQTERSVTCNLFNSSCMDSSNCSVWRCGGTADSGRNSRGISDEPQ